MYERTVIIIPTLNEKENLEKLIPEVFNLMYDVSILIVDDNSNDGTREMVESLKQNYPSLLIFNRTENFGYGRASLDGFKWALENNYDFIVTMDADFSHDFNVVPMLIGELSNSDISIGSRYVQGGGVMNWSFARRILSRFANFYVKMILGIPVLDATAGFNAYRADVFRKIDLGNINSDGYAFLVELKYRLFKAGGRFAEYPILFSERREGQSKMSTKIIWEAVKLPWKLRLGR